jgi:hypothetical protein
MSDSNCIKVYMDITVKDFLEEKNDLHLMNKSTPGCISARYRVLDPGS